MSAHPMLVLGIDSADPTLVQQWSEEGFLPTLHRLRRQGVWVDLQQQEPLPSAAVWPSIYTGVHPGKHGIYNGLHLARGQNRVCLVNPRECGAPPFWAALDAHQKQSIIMDVPFSYPLERFGGTQILDWGTYERHYKPHSIPREAVTRIVDRFGAYAFDGQMSRNVPTSPRQFRRVRSQLLEGVRRKGRVIKWLLSEYPWDFFMTVFSETHPAGHYFWRFHREDAANGTAVSEFVHTLREVYQQIDKQIGELVASLASPMIVVLSGQGIGPNHANWHVIPELLSGMGFLIRRSGFDQRKRGRPVGHKNWLAAARNAVPLEWRAAVSRYLPGQLRNYLRMHWANASIDFARSRAFPLPTDQLGYIRINLKGREPHGIVEPGPEYRALCDKISETLHSLTDPQTGKSIVREVFLSDRIFDGPQRDRLPDIIVTWQHEILPRDTFSSSVGPIKARSTDFRSGNHQPQGFAIFHGPGANEAQSLQARVVDIAPTILEYFGLNPPDYYDGSALRGIFAA